MSGSALEGGAVFEGEGQAAIRVGCGVVQQAAPELFTEGRDLAVLLLQDAELVYVLVIKDYLAIDYLLMLEG